MKTAKPVVSTAFRKKVIKRPLSSFCGGSGSHGVVCLKKRGSSPPQGKCEAHLCVSRCPLQLFPSERFLVDERENLTQQISDGVSRLDTSFQRSWYRETNEERRQGTEDRAGGDSEHSQAKQKHRGGSSVGSREQTFPHCRATWRVFKIRRVFVHLKFLLLASYHTLNCLPC